MPRILHSLKYKYFLNLFFGPLKIDKNTIYVTIFKYPKILNRKCLYFLKMKKNVTILMHFLSFNRVLVHHQHKNKLFNYHERRITYY